VRRVAVNSRTRYARNFSSLMRVLETAPRVQRIPEAWVCPRQDAVVNPRYGDGSTQQMCL
jgi:hypothetical protein